MDDIELKASRDTRSRSDPQIYKIGDKLSLKSSYFLYIFISRWREGKGVGEREFQTGNLCHVDVFLFDQPTVRDLLNLAAKVLLAFYLIKPPVIQLTCGVVILPLAIRNKEIQ